MDKHTPNNIQKKIISLLSNEKDALLFVNKKGEFIVANEKALSLINPHHHDLSKGYQSLLTSFAHKRLFCQLRKQIKRAETGIAQAFVWTTFHHKKPTRFITIIINQMPEKNASLIAIKFIDNTYLKIQSWLLELLTSIPEKNPNPIICLRPNGVLHYANKPGKEIFKQWHKTNNGLPPQLKLIMQLCQDTNLIHYQEVNWEENTYLFTCVWLKDINQINLYGTDITLLKNSERQIKNTANYDSLTHIANRQCFIEQMHHLLKTIKNKPANLALLLIDLDNFKLVNDTLGHPVGDKLLKIVTRRMAGCLRKDDFIARLGGDEFVVILQPIDESSAIIIADKINRKLATRFQIGEYNIDIAASIGIVLYPEGGKTIDELLKHADIALYQAKKSGGNHCVVINKSNTTPEISTAQIKKSLKQGSLQQQFHLYYQPQFNLNSNKIIGAETLLRWTHPKKGEIKPKEFLAHAEQTGTIQTIGRWGMAQAISDFSTLIWPHRNILLSLNVCISELQRPDFVSYIQELINQYHIDPTLLTLDISEKILQVPYKSAYPVLKDLKKLGINLSLDNFGGLQTPFTILIDLPISLLKIDETLLKNIENNAKQIQLIKGIIDFSHDIGYDVLQKGVENSSQNTLLKSIGCPNAQGYYYAKPMPLSQFKKLSSLNPLDENNDKLVQPMPD